MFLFIICLPCGSVTHFFIGAGVCARWVPPRDTFQHSQYMFPDDHADIFLPCGLLLLFSDPICVPCRGASHSFRRFAPEEMPQRDTPQHLSTTTTTCPTFHEACEILDLTHCYILSAACASMFAMR